MRLAVLVLLAACRIGFDDVPDGGTAVTPNSNVVCAPGTFCLVTCDGRERCDVACNGAAQCIVDCAGQTCTVSGCSGVTCTVDCGTGAPPTTYGQRATCP
jgi:hypothetical protein